MKILAIIMNIALISTAGAVRADMRNTDFIKSQPFHATKGWHLSDGSFMKSPLRIYEADMTILFTLADLGVARKYTKGSGYEPVRYLVNGKEKAVARLYFVNYADTDLGPYHEFILAIDTVPMKSQSVAIPYKNPEDVYASMFLPNYRVFLDFLILNKEKPIIGGIDAWGMDKHLGKTYFVNVDSGNVEQKVFHVLDGKGRPIAVSKLHIDKTLPEFGRSNPKDEFSPISAIPVGEINFDIRGLKAGEAPKKVSLVNYQLAWLYRSIRFDSKNDLLKIGDGFSRRTPWQKRLSELKMVPVVSLYGPRSQFTLTDL